MLKNQLVVIALFVAVPLVQATFGVILWLALPQATDRGLFGDMFGAMNALFSGLAFAGIVYTILFQRAEFSSNAAAVERSARLSAMSVLVSAYSERVRYLDSRASPESHKIQSYQSRIDALANQLEIEIKQSFEQQI